MGIVTGLFSNPGQALEAFNSLTTAGCDSDRVKVVASPTSAAELARATGVAGTDLGGLEASHLSEAKVREYEALVAQGAILLAVEVADAPAIERVTEILRRAGAEEVGAGAVHL